LQSSIARGSDTSCAQSCPGCMLVSTRGSPESLACSNSYDICLANHVLFSSLCIFRPLLRFCFLFCSPFPVLRYLYQPESGAWKRVQKLAPKLVKACLITCGRRRLWSSDGSNRKPFKSFHSKNSLPAQGSPNRKWACSALLLIHTSFQPRRLTPLMDASGQLFSASTFLCTIYGPRSKDTNETSHRRLDYAKFRRPLLSDTSPHEIPSLVRHFVAKTISAFRSAYSQHRTITLDLW